MRRHKQVDFLTVKAGVAILLLFLVLLMLLLFKPFSSKEVISEIENVSRNETFELNSSSEMLVDNLDTLSVAEITKVGSEGLCEEYLFGDGDILKILDHKILVETIGSKSIKIVVDGERKILSEEENEYFDSGIKLGIGRGSIFYYSVGSKENAVEIMVGCDYGANPNDKYVQDIGKAFCERSYVECLDNFGINK